MRQTHSNRDSKGRRATRLKGVAAAVAASAVLAACSSGGGSPASSGGGNLLQQIVKRGTVRIGECMGNQPYGFYSAANKPEGYDIDIASQIATGMGVKLDVVNVAPAARIPSLQTGKVDVVLCNTTRTLQRAVQVAFTNTYSVAASVILSKKGSGLTTLKSLAGKTVAITKGTPFPPLVQAAAPSAKVVQLDTPADDVTAVKQGQADAAIEDAGFLQYQAKQDPSLQVSTGTIIPLYYNSFAIKQGQANLLAWLNEFIFELNTSGQNKTLYRKWFGINPPYPLNPSY